MPNILTPYLEKAAEFHRAIAYQGAQKVRTGYHHHTLKDCERLAAANDNDPSAVAAYRQCEADNVKKLETARTKTVYKIGKQFRPNSPGDVLNEIVREFRGG